MKQTTAYRIVGILLTLVLLFGLIIGMMGCRTVDLARDKSNIDSTATQTKKYDSSTTNLVELLLKYGKQTDKEYLPGRDTTIIHEGEVKIIQLPGQLIRETVYEHGEQQQRTESSTTVSKSDSLLVELLKKVNTKEKETTGMGLTTMLLIGGLAIVLIALTALIFYFKAKHGAVKKALEKLTP